MKKKNLRTTLTALAAALCMTVSAPSMAFANSDYDAMYKSTDTYTVVLNNGYLPIRQTPSYEGSSNEIGRLHSGDTVEVRDSTDANYWYVYIPSQDLFGYVNRQYLVEETNSSVNSSEMIVNVPKGYLALRTEEAYDDANEIGELYTGDTVEVLSWSNGKYWYVYSPKYNTTGYVNKDYLVGTRYGGVTITKEVRVSSGYLALRNAQAYDSSNEIGSLYTGETVQVINWTTGKYWYVYSPKLELYGYVNSNYLYDTDDAMIGVYRTVHVDSGYLALRNAQSYSSGNEIGSLYTGDMVQVLDWSNGKYWYVYSPKLDCRGYCNIEYLY